MSKLYKEILEKVRATEIEEQKALAEFIGKVKA